MAQPKYDVAISFLSADESVAAALYNRLSEGLEVFFYPRRQEELAFTDGLEEMRAPFLDDSRTVVVLYREPWGETQWTRVEQTAIQDSCLKHGWQRLLFIMLDKTNPPPRWLPAHRVRFNYADFGLEGAIGAIRARVLEAGGVITALTALKLAELSKLETQYLRERDHLRSPFGHDDVERAAGELFTKVTEVCTEINANGSASIQFALDTERAFGRDRDPHGCHLRDRVSLIATLDLHSEADLIVREFDKKQPMIGENLAYLNGRPNLVGDSRFLPDINRAREVGWCEYGEPSKFLASAELADVIVRLFIDINARAERGEFQRPIAPQSQLRAKRR
jgi:hypothetical protein